MAKRPSSYGKRELVYMANETYLLWDIDTLLADSVGRARGRYHLRPAAGMFESLSLSLSLFLFLSLSLSLSLSFSLSLSLSLSLSVCVCMTIGDVTGAVGVQHVAHVHERESVVYWYSFSNPRTRCIHLTNTIDNNTSENKMPGRRF